MRLNEEADRHDSSGTASHSWPLPALSHWKVEVGGAGMEEMRGASFDRSSPPFLGRERAAVGVDVDPGRRSPRCHETCLDGVYHLQLGLLLLHRTV